MHHMGDWEWMGGGNGRILQQVKAPCLTATLVKYAELVCLHPGSQAELQGITEDDGIDEHKHKMIKGRALIVLFFYY